MAHHGPRDQRGALRRIAVAVCGAVLALLLLATPAAANPDGEGDPIDVAQLVADLDLFPDGQLDEDGLARFSAQLSDAGADSAGLGPMARALAAAAQQYQNVAQPSAPVAPEVLEANLSALSATMGSIAGQLDHPVLRRNFEQLSAAVQQLRSAPVNGSDGGAVRDAPGEPIASRRGPALALIGIALTALALGVLRLSTSRRRRPATK